MLESLKNTFLKKLHEKDSVFTDQLLLCNFESLDKAKFVAGQHRGLREAEKIFIETINALYREEQLGAQLLDANSK